MQRLQSVPVVLQGVIKSYQEADLQNGGRRKGRDFAEHAKVTAVDHVSLEFPPGELVTLLGPSGCGKTTTLRCIAGFSEPDSGTIRIGAQVVNGVQPYDRPTGTVFQNYALFPHMTVFENVAYGLRIKKLPKAEIEHKVLHALELLHLREFADRPPSQLSGGQQQRVAIARVIVNEPQVLLLDEPLSNLDAKLRVYMRLELKHLQRELGITTIYVTHDQEEAMAISDRMAVMNHGRIEQFGTPLDIYRQPMTQFVAEFIGIANMLEGTVRRVLGGQGHVAVDVQGVLVPGEPDKPYAVGEKVQLAIRPETFRLEPAESMTGDRADDMASDVVGGSWFGHVKSAAFLGPVAHYEVEIADVVTAGQDAQSASQRVTVYQFNPGRMFKAGDAVAVSVANGNIPVRQGWSAKSILDVRRGDAAR